MFFRQCLDKHAKARDRGGTTSCIGDGTVAVTGEVRSVEGMPLSGCILTLRWIEGDRVVGSREIAEKFTENFIVAPGKDEYRAEVTCDGYARPYVRDGLISNVHKGSLADPYVLDVVINGQHTSEERQ